MPYTETGVSVRRANIAASAISAALIDTSAVTSAKIAASNVSTAKLNTNAVTSRTISGSNVVAAKINTSAVIARTVAASAITRVKLQASALQLHLRTTTVGNGVNSVGAGTGAYSARVGFAARWVWARAVAQRRIAVVGSINSSQVRIQLYSSRGNLSNITGLLGVPGGAGAIFWCALR